MRHEFPVLFKYSNKGVAQQWQIIVEDNTFYTIEGQVSGKLTTSAKTVCKPKNVGRTNESRGFDQAMLEAQSKFKTKTEKDYNEVLTDEKRFWVQLAHTYKKQKDKIKFPCYSAQKYDGMRCYTNIEGMFSRENNPVVSNPHIYKELKHTFDVYPDMVWDGELYCHKGINFEYLIGLCRTTVKITPELLAETEKHMKYYVFDCFLPDQPDLIYSERLKIIEERLPKHPYFVIAPVKLVNDQEQLDDEYADYLSQGFEGQMVRNSDSPYEQKRSYNIQKRKEFVDDEYEVAGVLEGEGGRAGTAGKIVFVDSRKITFEAGIRNTHERSRYIWNNPNEFIGKKMTVRYHHFTAKGIPLHGTTDTIIRDYE